MREVIRPRAVESATISEAVPATIDVRTIAPGERHDRIFSAFKALPQGGALELMNDHDPQPLYRQFKSNFHGLFTWDYLEQGPDLWRVRIGRAPGNCCGSCS
ncbi:MAG: DUF2249 domain-containing protein [Burkholderiaceae bacterium]|nr:DUF2249 domain-containing protein [Burkholderiaceae bacterium]MEB2350610.1 DUF2249 domain-containing protein [Burkholderiaceae bacterium]